MTLWSTVRDELRRGAWAGRLGRQVALRLVEAMRRVLAGGRRVFVLGPWPRVFDALGLPKPSGKAARAALGLLADVCPGVVVRVTAQTWRVVSHAVDQVVGEQLELAYDPKGKAESGPAPAQPARPARPRTPRARARAAELERVWGREPAAQPARRLSRAVEQLGALEAGTAWSVTLTVPEGADATAVAEAFAERVRLVGASVELVPERAPGTGRLHYHGIAVVPDEVLDPDAFDAKEDLHLWAREAGAGSTDISSIRDVQRLRHWAGYAWKAPADDLPVLRVGELGRRREASGDEQGREHDGGGPGRRGANLGPSPKREPGLLRRAVAALGRMWRGRATKPIALATIIDGMARAAGRVEVVLPDRGRYGRFVGVRS